MKQRPTQASGLGAVRSVREELLKLKVPQPSNEEVWRLAMLAAPLMAAGRIATDAVDAARQLQDAAALRLKSEAFQGREKLLLWTLDHVISKFGVKSRAILEDLKMHLGDSEGIDALWKRALKGEPVFTYELIQGLVAVRGRKLKAQQESASLARIAANVNSPRRKTVK